MTPKTDKPNEPTQAKPTTEEAPPPSILIVFHGPGQSGLRLRIDPRIDEVQLAGAVKILSIESDVRIRERMYQAIAEEEKAAAEEERLKPKIVVPGIQ